MKLTKSRLKQIIKEELSLLGSLDIEENFVKKHSLTEDDEASAVAVSDEIWDAYTMVVDNVGKMSRDMNHKDSYAFLGLLKKYFNRIIPDEEKSREDLEEVSSEEQRGWACSKPPELTDDQAEHMCADVEHSKKKK